MFMNYKIVLHVFALSAVFGNGMTFGMGDRCLVFMKKSDANRQDPQPDVRLKLSVDTLQGEPVGRVDIWQRAPQGKDYFYNKGSAVLTPHSLQRIMKVYEDKMIICQYAVAENAFPRKEDAVPAFLYFPRSEKEQLSHLMVSFVDSCEEESDEQEVDFEDDSSEEETLLAHY